MTIKYFAKADDNPSSETYGEKRALFRFDDDPKNFNMERWTGDGWEWDPELIGHTGIGGENGYHPITAKEATDLQKKLS